MTHNIASACVVVSGLLVSSVACATAITMNFDTLGSNYYQYIDRYYAGGCTTARFGTNVCGGPNYGINWGGFESTDSGSNIPSPPNFADVPFGGGLGILAVADGFSGTLSFQYSEPETGTSRSITIYSGTDGMGTVLGTYSLPSTGSSCSGGGYYSCWDLFSASFNGTARSAMLSNVSANGSSDNDFAIDNVSLDLVPGPAALGTFGFGMLLIGAFMGLRWRAGAATRGTA